MFKSALASLVAFAALASSAGLRLPMGTSMHFDTPAGSSASSFCRFRYRRPGGDYQIIRDFGPQGSLDWMPPLREGMYELETAMRDVNTGQTFITAELFQVTSRVPAGGAPVISPTSHPLVFLYSAAACGARHRIRVEFTSGDGNTHRTPFKACSAGESSNFYLAGLYPDTGYTVRHTVDTGDEFKDGPVLAFQSGSLPDGLYTQAPVRGIPDGESNPVLLGTSSSMGSVATDLSGAIIWYLPSGAVTFLTRAEPGGYFWGIQEDFAGSPATNAIRKFDLTGSVVLETNAARVSAQLTAMGKRPISGFHHEARTLPDGRIVALATVEQMMTDVQGAGAVDILGDMIVVMDKDLNVVWAWDAFDNLDVNRKAVLGETCASSNACSPHFLAKEANDWTHGNAVQQTPDGNFLYSSRHQDWLIKIAYDNGEGDGHVIWRMGRDGDFSFLSNDVYPWFSHQHDGNFLLSDPSTLLVYDDGNTRVTELEQGHSRGQVLQVDEENRIVTALVNADLGVYSLAVGSAQRLRDGNFFFDSGYVPESGGTVSYLAEVGTDGQMVYQAKANTILYRAFRMTDMYSPN